MYLYLFNLINDLNEYNYRVNNLLQSSNLDIKSELWLCDFTGAGHHQQTCPKEYLFI